MTTDTKDSVPTERQGPVTRLRLSRPERMKRYIMVIEPAAHPEARRKLIVEARDDGDAYDQAADHAATELPYRCTIAIAKIDEIVERPPRQPKLVMPAGDSYPDLPGSALSGQPLPPVSMGSRPQPPVGPANAAAENRPS